MKHSRQFDFCSTLPLLCLVLGLAMVNPHLGLATDLPLYGGPGGNEFPPAKCPKGWYLVGLAGRTGEWVDQVAPVCAPWLQGAQTLGAPSIGPSFGTSSGGRAVTPPPICQSPNGQHLVIRSWFIETLRSANKFVQYVAAMCEPLMPSLVRSSEIVWFGFGSDPRDAITYTPYGRPYTGRGGEQNCPAGEAAVGFRVRAGQFVDAVGLICGPVPTGAPATKLPGPRVQAPSPAVTMNPQAKNLKIAADMFVITKPVPGQLIPHDQLIIIATAPEAPPTVGPPRYAELELRCLEAPPNLQFSSPYFHVITVEEAKLRQGYAVGKEVTGACSGGWQVRARFSLNAPTGPWSAAVPFQLCFNHCPYTAPSAIQQTAPSPSSSIMQSAPSSQKSTSSSLMIRPRGVEEKGGKQSNETVDTTPEPEKKP